MTVVDETFWWAHRCLSGEITPSMRMVVLRIDAKRVTLRYYLDIKENSFLRERAEIVAVNFDSGLSTKLDALDRLCCTNRSEAVLPLSQTDLAYGDGMGYAKRCEAVQDRGADLDLGNLAIKVTRREALTE